MTQISSILPLNEDVQPVTGARGGLPRTWRGSACFVGREEHVQRVLRELDRQPEQGAATIVSISGVGGIGKTTLLREILARSPRSTVYVGADDRDQIGDPLRLARLLATRLAEVLGPRSHCARALRGPVQANDARREMSVPYEGEATLLADAVVCDANDVGSSTGRQVVVVLDGYEGIRDVVAPWLMDTLLGGRLTPMTGDLRLLVAAREPLQRTHPRWLAEWDDFILNIELEPFTISETRQYLTVRRGATNCTSDEIETAYQLTGGLPVWLALWRPPSIGLARSSDLASPECVQAVVDRFLMWWGDPAQQHWVRLAWIPRWFNQEILAILLGDEAQAAYDWLTRQAAIVRTDRNGWRFHEVVRSALRYDTLQRAPESLAAAHDKLAAYWRHRRPGEAIYHAMLGADPQRGMSLLCEQYARAAVTRDGVAQLEIVIAAQAARSEADPGLDPRPIDVVSRHWAACETGDAATEKTARVEFLQLGLLAAADRAALLGQMLEPADSGPDAQHGSIDLEPTQKPRRRWPWSLFARRSSPHAPAAANDDRDVLLQYGDSLRLADQPEAALPPLTRAIALDDENVAALVSRGEALRVLGRHADAIDDFTDAIRLTPEDPWPWTLRSATHLAAEHWRAALTDAEHATQLEPRGAWGWALRGLAECQVEQYPTAQAYAFVRRGLQLDPSLEWARSALERWDSVLATHQAVANGNQDPD